MSRITIENINGKNHTVVWHDSKVENLRGRRFATLNSGVKEVFLDDYCLNHIATALPALLRYSNLRTEKDRIKHLREVSAYISAGIGINGTLAFNFSGADAFKVIESGYILETKEIVNIAITDEASDEQV